MIFAHRIVQSTSSSANRDETNKGIRNKLRQANAGSKRDSAWLGDERH